MRNGWNWKYPLSYMYPAYTQLVAKWSSPSIGDRRATGWRGHIYVSYFCKSCIWAKGWNKENFVFRLKCPRINSGKPAFCVVCPINNHQSVGHWAKYWCRKRCFIIFQCYVIFIIKFILEKIEFSAANFLLNHLEFIYSLDLTSFKVLDTSKLEIYEKQKCLRFPLNHLKFNGSKGRWLIPWTRSKRRKRKIISGSACSKSAKIEQKFPPPTAIQQYKLQLKLHNAVPNIDVPIGVK